MIQINHYAGHIIILAAVSLVSCQRTQESAQSPGTGATAAQTQSSEQHEAEVPASTVLWVQLQKDLDSSKLKPGDHFSASLAEDVILNGKPVIAKETILQGRIANSQTAQDKGSASLLSLVLDSVTLRGTTCEITTGPVTLQSATLEQDIPKAAATKVATEAASAYVPEKGILQFFLANAVRVRT